MNEITSAIEDRVTRLERSVRRTQLTAAAVGVVLVVLVGLQFAREPGKVSTELRTRRLVVVDDEGRERVRIDQDAKNSERRSRSAGLTVFDSTGTERGGFSTFDDGSVVFSMDAPRGVGAPMRDRIGLMVYPDGGTYINMLDNQTRAVARLYTEADGHAGVQVLKWDMDAKQIHVRSLTYDGDQRETVPIGQ